MMSTQKDDKTICDNCSNYEVTPNGCSEVCHINAKYPHDLSDWYFEQRRDGVNTTCKDYSSLRFFKQ